MSPSSPARLFVHVQVADFLIEAERFGAPALAGRPLVIGGVPDSPARVVAASVEARARGVTPGLPVRAAARLCPSAVFRPGTVERQHDLRGLVDESIRHHVERLAWVSIDEAVLDFGWTEPALARRTAEAIQHDVREQLGLSLAFGVAATGLAARVAARMGLPSGLVVVLPGYDARFLAAQPVEELDGLDERAAARLRAEGVRTLGEVAALAPERIMAVLGRGGPSLARLARGEEPPVPELTRTPRRLCRQRLLSRGDRPDEVTAALAAEVALALRHHGCAATTLGLRAEDAQGRSQSHATPLADPASEVAELVRAARHLLAKLGTAAADARLLSMAATGLVEAEPQGELFGPRGRVRDRTSPGRLSATRPARHRLAG